MNDSQEQTDLRQQLAECQAALAGMRQALEALLDWGGWRHCGCGWCLRCRVVKPALASDFGRDRLALERDTAGGLDRLYRALWSDSVTLEEQSAAVETVEAILVRLRQAGLL